ncbi:neprilysin-1-like isoform X2 [Periplaneta americana]|uniref:neprilysin-1-like isoform X2 n=1 Tax=Periplaneta americana TaxID=6978 RepID=UPI0037E871E3
MRFGYIGVFVLAAIGIFTIVCSKRCRTRQCRKEANYLRKSIKLSEDPCKDFYTFACGNFIWSHSVPNGTLSWGPFEIADNNTMYTMKAILSSPKLSTEPVTLEKAKTMYAACMDNETREQRGLHSLMHIIKQLGGWPLISNNWNGSVTWSHVANVISEYGIPLFFDISVKPHPSNKSLNIIHLNTPSLALPVPLQRKTESAVDMLAFPHRKRDLLMFLENIALELLNHKGQTKVLRSRIREELQEVVDLAYTLQGVSHFERWLNLPKYKAIPIRSLNNTNGKIDWLEFLQTVFGKTDLKLTSKQLVYIPDGKLIYNILQIFNTTDSRVLANYVVSCIVMYLAPETTERMHSFLMHLYHKLEIIPKEHPRWQYCVHKVRDYPDMGLGPAIAYAYMNDHFDRNNVLRVAQLLNDLHVATLQLLSENKWIDDDSKQQVIEKVQSMSVLAGFPDWIANRSVLDEVYKKLVIHEDDHFGNVARMHSYMQTLNFMMLGIDEDAVLKWNSSPFVVNAFYEMTRNSITLPAAIMQHPFYTGQNNIIRVSRKKRRRHKSTNRTLRKKSKNGKRNRRAQESILMAMDYGRFGTVVGHEITHGFDDQGHLYDSRGEKYVQWNNSTERIFRTKAKCFTRQYDQCDCSFDLTLGEDIADNGGLRKAYRAFKRAWTRVNGLNVTLPGLPNFTPEQLFFLGYATVLQSGKESG